MILLFTASTLARLFVFTVVNFPFEYLLIHNVTMLSIPQNKVIFISPANSKHIISGFPANLKSTITRFPANSKHINPGFPANLVYGAKLMSLGIDP